MLIRRTKWFDRSFKTLDVKIKNKAIATIDLFMENPFHSLLNNHKLTGSLAGLSSINVTGDYRILFRDAQMEGMN